MRFATHRLGSSFLVTSIVAMMVAIAPPPSLAQDGGTPGTGGPPGIDHYLVYSATPLAGSHPVVLRDQFMPLTTHVADPFEFYANPVSKNGEGIVDPILHYAWWHINPPRPFSGAIVASNQFGDQTLQLGPAEYLWNPSLKNVQVPPVPPLPHANHYLCYRATGQFVPRTVTLQDQFGSYQATVIAPEWFCNPVEKTYEGQVEPIVRPDAHQTCYRVQPLTPFPPTTITFLDEFTFGTTVLQQQVWLCVPSFKEPVVPAQTSSWGSVKATYR
jgi:hypothetical protein